MNRKDGTPQRQNGGKPLIFKTADDLKKKIDEYISFVKNDETEFANVAGFCVFADITRETYYNYKNRYFDTIKKFELFLENHTLSTSKMHPTMKIFYMKNKFSDQYRDKIEYDVNSNSEINITLTQDE